MRKISVIRLSVLVYSVGSRAASFEVPVTLEVGGSSVTLGLTDTIGTVSTCILRKSTLITHYYNRGAYYSEVYFCTFLDKRI